MRGRAVSSSVKEVSLRPRGILTSQNNQNYSEQLSNHYSSLKHNSFIRSSCQLRAASPPSSLILPACRRSASSPTNNVIVSVLVFFFFFFTIRTIVIYGSVRFDTPYCFQFNKADGADRGSASGKAVGAKGKNGFTEGGSIMRLI